MEDIQKQKSKTFKARNFDLQGVAGPIYSVVPLVPALLGFIVTLVMVSPKSIEWGLVLTALCFAWVMVAFKSLDYFFINRYVFQDDNFLIKQGFSTLLKLPCSDCKILLIHNGSEEITITSKHVKGRLIRLEPEDYEDFRSVISEKIVEREKITTELISNQVKYK